MTLAAIFGAQPVAEAHEENLDARIRDYLLQNPEIILEALEVMSKRDAQAGLLRKLDAFPDLFTRPAELGLGAPEAPIKVVEFFDYRCAPCKAVHPKLKAFVNANPDLRIEMRQLPILSPGSERAARFALAVLDQYGPVAYGAVHDRLWDLKGPLNLAAFAMIAKAEGLDFESVDAAMNKPSVDQRIARNRDMAIAFEILGTPAFVSRTSVIFGNTDLEVLGKAWLGP